MTDWNKLKVPELKAELKKRGLAQTGLKAALVARLTTSENESGFESEATLQDDLAEPSNNSQTPTNPDTDAEPTTEPHLDQAAVESPTAAALETPKPLIPTAPPTPEIAKEIVASDAKLESPSVADTLPVVTLDVTPKASLPPSDSLEVVEDIQKRKRRSQSPPPTESDAPRKRARQDRDLPLTNLDSGQHERHIATEEEAAGEAENKGIETTALPEDAAMSDNPIDNEFVSNAKGAREGPDAKDEDTEMGFIEEVKPIIATEEEFSGRQRDSRFKDLFSPDHTKANRETPHENARSNLEASDAMDIEPDRHVAPSVHPATSALYIRDMMRPLNPAALKEHLTTLATPPGATPDASVIVDFFLDPIRTHSFVSFTNIAAASRVRSELHERIWPDERTRKPLWVDFVPPEKIQDWVEEEHASGATRSGAKKWEVVYNFDDGGVVVNLQETGITPAAARKPSFTVPQPRAAIPGKPGIQGAPSGPRAHQPSIARLAANSAAIDHLFKSTVAHPVLYYQPVSKELALKRLDNIDRLTSKRHSTRDGGSEINRYSFEDGENLVDRGPEIFSGIRPPPGHRGRGGGGGYRGGRGGRGGDRYDGRRRDDWESRDRDRRF